MRRPLLGLAALALAALASPADAGEPRVLSFLGEWVEAWEAQDLERYLAFYAEDATVGRRDRAALRAHKAAVFAREGRVAVSIGDVEVENRGATLRVTFLQDYSSDSLEDFGRKELVLRPSGEGFRILRETWTAAPGPIARSLAEQLAGSRPAVEAPAPARPAESAGTLPPEPEFTPLEPATPVAEGPGDAEALEPLLGGGYAPPAARPPAASSGADEDLLALEPLVGQAPTFLQPVSFPGLPGDIGDNTLVEEVVARVNGRVLTRSGFIERLEGRHLQLMLEQPENLEGRLAGIVSETLAQTVERWLLVQEAAVNRAEVESFWRQWLSGFRQEVGAADMQEVQQLLQAEGMTIETLREQVVANEVVQQKVTARIDRSDAHVREYYEANAARYAEPAQVSLRQILIPAEQAADLPRAEKAAEDALGQLNDGADWCDVAAVYGAGQVPCGDIGTVPLLDLVPELREAAAGLPLEAVSKPIRTAAGLHLVQVRARSATELRPLEEVRARVETDMVDEDFGRLLEEYIQQLRDTSVIEINPRYRDLWEATVVGQ